MHEHEEEKQANRNVESDKPMEVQLGGRHLTLAVVALGIGQARRGRSAAA